MKDVEELEGISRISEEFLFQMSRRKHRTVCTRRLLSTTLTAACFIAGTDFTAAYLLSMPTNPGFVFTRPPPPFALEAESTFTTEAPPCWSSFLSPKFAYRSLLRCGPSSGCQTRRFLGSRESSPIFFIVLYFAFFGDSLVSGSVLTALWHIALLEGVCWNSGSCASMRNAPDT